MKEFGIDMYSPVWYYLGMLQNGNETKVYTPEQVAEMLQISKNTVYELINRGEIIAKKIGKLYRIPAKSISFFINGLDDDIYEADEIDRQNLSKISEEIALARKKL